MFKKNVSLQKILTSIILIIIDIILFNKKSYKINFDKNKYFYQNYDNNYYIKLININYSFSLNYKIVKVEYIIGFYNDNDDLIHPSDLTLYNNLHIICNYKEDNIINIYSLAHIYNNKFMKCLSFLNIQQKVKFGINIIKKNKKYYSNNYFFFLTIEE